MPHSVSGPSGFLGLFFIEALMKAKLKSMLSITAYLSAYSHTTFSKLNASSREEDRCGMPYSY
jgi:hypothetical protein